MAARAHWFEDEDAPKDDEAAAAEDAVAEPTIRNDAARRASARPGAHLHPDRAARARATSLIRLALAPDGEVAPDVRARAPGRGAWIGVDRAELDAANAKGKLQGRAGPCVQDRERRRPRRSRRADRGGAARRLRSTGSGWRRAPATSSSAPTRSRPPRARARSICCSTPPTPARTAAASSTRRWRVGGAEGSAPGAGISRGAHYIVDWRLGRENVVHVALTDPRRRGACSHALARWRAFIGPRSMG